MGEDYNQSTRERVADINAGLRVSKSSIAIAAISTKSLFTVIGGNCLIIGLIGEVTTIIETQANASKYISTPTVGTAVDLCAAVDITAQEVGGLFTITGVLAADAVKGTAGAGVMMTTRQIVAPGIIGFNTAADNTGALKFTIWYVPLEDGAYIEPA